MKNLTLIGLVVGIALVLGYLYRSGHLIQVSGSTFSSGLTSSSETTENSYPFEKNGTLCIKTQNGSISITTHDKDELLVKEIKQGDKELFDQIKTEVTITPVTASIHTVSTQTSGNLSISYELTVPALTTITQADSENGQVSIDGIQKAVTAHSTNGQLQFANIAGIISASNSNGGISVQNCPRLATATTSNGNITLQSDTMEAMKAPIVIQSSNGSISFACNDCGKNSYQITNSNGSISITLPASPTNYSSAKQLMGGQATFSSGQAQFNVQTERGSLRIHPLAR